MMPITEKYRAIYAGYFVHRAERRSCRSGLHWIIQGANIDAYIRSAF